MQFRQTVKIANDLQRGIRVFATELLRMAPEEFHSLRRSVLEARTAKELREPRFSCAICGIGLHLTLHGSGNRYFVHDSEPPSCPWYTGSAATREQKAAEEFLWEKESAEHHRLKWLIANALNRDPDVEGSAVVQETLWGKLLDGRWRRPDVLCSWRGKKIAFEIQLGTTHLREVVARETFYQDERIYVIWVFHPSVLGLAPHADERYFNRRNIFVVHESEDEDGPAPTGLTLRCRYDVPYLSEDAQVKTKTEEAIVALSNLVFPDNHFRPYFYDFEAKRLEVEAAAVVRREELRLAEQRKAAERANRVASTAIVHPTRLASLLKIAPVPDELLEAKALDLFRARLDTYRWNMDSPEQRLGSFSPIVRLLPDYGLVEAAYASLRFPRFQVLLFIRGLETARPIPESAPALPQWCNERLADLDHPDAEVLESLVGYAAWSAYPPSQPREIQDSHYKTLGRLVQAVLLRGISPTEQTALEFAYKLFPRVGDVLRPKLEGHPT